jgi:DNA-binding MarR family transcriptional regulator
MTMATRIQALRDEHGAPQRGRRGPALKAIVSDDERLEAYGGAAVVELARRMVQLRRRRDASLGSELFSEPAWNILLYLFLAGADGLTVSVSAACEGAAAPQTTALRRLRQLEEARLIVREGDPRDARRDYVRLSALACRKMRSLLKGGCSRLHDES